MPTRSTNPYKDLTWEEWDNMHWRERARVRRFRQPPRPPLRAQLALSDVQQRELTRIARERKTTTDRLATEAVSRFLAGQRRVKNKQVKQPARRVSA